VKTFRIDPSSSPTGDWSQSTLHHETGVRPHLHDHVCSRHRFQRKWGL